MVVNCLVGMGLKAHAHYAIHVHTDHISVDRLLIWHTEMYVFDLNRCTDRLIPTGDLSKYARRGRKSSSGYVP